MDELKLFSDVIAITDPAQRAAFLDRACSDQPDVRRRIDELLDAHAKSNPFLDVTIAAPAIAASVPSERAGAVIAGRYKLLESVGEGGMGTVWVAEQTAPVRRKVAIKLIKAGMDSRSVLARFEAERQALAMMDHPSIAKVLDGGLTDTGRPYFVMEYVKGVPITEYCDAVRLSVPERLTLFAQVCQAVQHAHQKGIIHRDLKPSNILVAPYDDLPVPKIIDFGLAKAMHQSLTDKTLHTAHESVMGTPLYMSPEQAQLNNLDVDTRSDIYSLGVLLYELLTGTTPLERQRFKTAAWDEVRRIIREEDPPRPSTRLSSIDTLPSLAACRHTEPVKLTREVRGELDWIVMKALEKDRTRRYETANGLARDIHRYLSHEAVEACPPSASYRLRKFARKYRAPLMTAAVIAGVLVGGIVVSSWQAVRAMRAEGAARSAAESERLAKLEAEKSAAAEKLANQQSQKRLAHIEKGNKIITSIFDDLDLRKVKEGTEPLEVVLAKRLLNAAKQLDGDDVGDPLAVAELRYQLSDSLHSLGHLKEATDLVVKARDTFAAHLGPDHANTLSATRSVADFYNAAGRWREALPMWEETLKRAKAKLGPDDHLTLMCMSGLATCYHYAEMFDRSVPLQEEIAAIIKQKKGPEHIDTLNAMANSAASFKDAGKIDRAIAILEEVLKLHAAKGGADHVDAVAWRNKLASCYAKAEKHDLAISMMAEVVALRKVKLGLDHLETLRAMALLGRVYVNAGQVARAIPVFEEVLKLSRAKFGSGHPDTVRYMGDLGSAYVDVGELDRALPLLEEAVSLSKDESGADTSATFEIKLRLAKCYGAAGKAGQQLTLLEKTLADARAKLPADHPATLTCISTLALAYHKAGKLDLAIALNDEFIRLDGAKYGVDNPDVLRCMTNQAQVYLSAGKPDRALPLYLEVARLRRARLGVDHPDTIQSIFNIGHTCQLLGKPAQAMPHFEEVLKITRAKFGDGHPDTQSIMSKVGVCYWQLRQLDKSIPLFRELLEIKEKQFGRDHPNTLTTVANLGVNYRDARRFDEAIPLLEEVNRASTRHEELRWAAKELLATFVAAKRLDPAVKLINEQLAQYQNRLPGKTPRDMLLWSSLIDAIGGDLIRANRFAEAEPLFRESLAILEKHSPDGWNTFNTMSGLGMTLLGQKKYADAEPVLRKSYEGLKQREQTIPKTPDAHLRMLGILDRLIEVSAAIDKPDDVKKWQAERTKYPAEATTVPTSDNK